MSDLIRELRRHQRDYPSLVHGPLCGEAADHIEELVKALEEIVNPVQAMRNRADAEGMQLDGHVAVNLANDPHYLRELARKALSRPVGTPCK